MQVGHVTTPFGRRPVSYAMLQRQAEVSKVKDRASVEKWKIYRALCEARSRFGVSDRALAVLNALLSFYPEDELRAEDGLIVFPSNARLSVRAHGMAEQTIRRHIAALVDAGLLIRRDSANGKRFARRGAQGAINEAFGFSLAPLLARAEEILFQAAEVEAERLELQQIKERLTICRRDIVKLIETALEENAPGDWLEIQTQYRSILTALPRRADFNRLAETLADLETLRENIANQLTMLLEIKNKSGNDQQTERHIQNSDTESIIKLEAVSKTACSSDPSNSIPINPTEPNQQDEKLSAKTYAPEIQSAVIFKPFPLSMILLACPQIADYGPNGSITSWREMINATAVVRSMLGVSSSAYEKACAVLGPENTATIIACILEKAGHINSAGGYLRDLTRRAERGEFSLGPMLMAQARINGHLGRKAG